MADVMTFPELPHYLTIKKVVDGDTVKVQVESTIHVNRLVTMPTQFSTDFVRNKPNTFRNDVLCFVVRRYGLTLSPRHYH
jgi:hypothetical protein